MFDICLDHDLAFKIIQIVCPIVSEGMLEDTSGTV